MSTSENIKKILCIGDSLALPGHLNAYEDTWFSQLKSAFPSLDFISFFKRAITTEVLVNEGGGDGIDRLPRGADCLEFYNPDVVVLQLGIVDCAPRYIRKKSLTNKVIGRLPRPLKSLAFATLKKLTSRSVLKADVPPAAFKNNLTKYLERCQKTAVKKVIVIKICTPDERIRVRSPYLMDAVHVYNSILDEIAGKFEVAVCVDPLNSATIQEEIFEDGYHPNALGNKLVSESLAREIQPLVYE